MHTYNPNIVLHLDPKTRGKRNKGHYIYYRPETEDQITAFQTQLKNDGIPPRLLSVGTIFECLIHSPQAEAILTETMNAIIEEHLTD